MLDIQSILLFLGVLLVSATLHEMMHAYIALRLGDDLANAHGRISFNPFVHIDPILTIALPALLLLLGQPPILAAKPVPINTSRLQGGELGMAAVGISGPLVNLAIAFIAGAVLQVTDLSGIALTIGELFVLVNVGLFVFNMLPIPPLDGSRVLYAVAPPGLQSIMRQMESFGIFGLILILTLAYPVIAPILTTMREFVLRLVV